LVAFGLLAGCKADDDEPRGRGTAACRDFQDAVCDFAADQCRASDRGTCDSVFQGVECKSDSAASACANGLNDAVCGGAASSCDLSQIIDTQPAIDRCHTLIGMLCGHLADCGQVPSREQCEATPAMLGVDCAQAASASLRYEDCIAKLDGLACGAQVPSECNKVIGIVPNLAGM
jgi:hypothetical protein